VLKINRISKKGAIFNYFVLVKESQLIIQIKTCWLNHLNISRITQQNRQKANHSGDGRNITYQMNKH